MSQERFELRRLDISGLDLTLVPADCLASALTNLEQVEPVMANWVATLTQVSLAESWLCPDQVKAFFRALASTARSPTSSSPSSPSLMPSSASSTEHQRKLAVVNLRGVPLTFLDPAAFAFAISQVLPDLGPKTSYLLLQSLLCLLPNKIWHDFVWKLFLNCHFWCLQLEEVDITETRLTRMQRRQICHILLNPSKVRRTYINN